MGKQKGDGARSKTRPSSSNLAASLLQSETTGVGFGGYVGSTRIDMTSTTEQSTLLDIDGEVAQHLRRISKKDPTTKLKALTSLSTLFRQIPVSELCQIAPAWVFEYKRLVQDNSRQVRQAAHDAMANLAFTIGKGLAPHLRFVMGAWWLGQFDPFTEVSEAAKQSFQVQGMCSHSMASQGGDAACCYANVEDACQTGCNAACDRATHNGYSPGSAYKDCSEACFEACVRRDAAIGKFSTTVVKVDK